MKNNLIYIASFLTAFIAITLVIVHLNSMYRNIFQFDFTEVKQTPEELSFASDEFGRRFESLKNYIDKEFKNHILDSIKANTLVKIDTVYQEILKDEMLADSLDKLKLQLENLKNEVATLDTSTEDTTLPNQPDEDWAKQTAKLIEAMNPKNAAKVIQKYSDNEARELIYRMKKNKAAAILSLLDPSFVNRITKSEI